MMIRSRIAWFILIVTGTRLHADPVHYRDVRTLLDRHCVTCHGARLSQSGLRLDTVPAALKGGRRGPAIIAGKSEASLLIQALTGTGSMPRMPFNSEPLPLSDIALLKAWIDQGAKGGETDSQVDKSKHWAFISPKHSKPPRVISGWCRNAIDEFIFARLAEKKLRPSPEADRATLIRRLSLDLLGIPPSVPDIDAFLADRHPGAYERLVDRLLNSPQYGERWARHWLDIARYADSNGFNIDAPRSIWMYRDWVIDAFNRDMPYDQFIVEQIAGDMLPNANTSQKIATGFHRNTLINQEGGIDKEQFRVESIVDRVNTTATAFLGITLACAQCHDHKFDPFSQREYYQFYAFFNNADEPDLEMATPEEITRRDAIRAEIEVCAKDLESYRKSLELKQIEWEKNLDPAAYSKLSIEIQTILKKLASERTLEERGKVTEAFHLQDPGIQKRQAALAELTKREPQFDSTMILVERKTPRETCIHIQGNFTRKGERVAPQVPAVLHSLPDKNTAYDRLDFAKWLSDPKNPLTARITMNRIWQHYFGRGLVETENDFGTQGARPTHAELLDWLATEFFARGWSLKAMHRLIVNSATYRQSSRHRPDLEKVDPSNILLARQSRMRLDAEIVRDSSLAASGLLSRKIGGKSVFPPQPEGVMTQGQMKRTWETSTGEDRYRRGMYTFLWRATPYPTMIVFDGPDAMATCTRRNRSNTPTQALTLLNDQAFFESARSLSFRILREAPNTDSERMRYAFRLCFARNPDSEELSRLSSLLEQQRIGLADRTEEARSIVLGTSANENPLAQVDVREIAAWTVVARVLLNLDEFITRE